ncbi:MAG: ATP-binding protein [Thermoanaerobaculia bacterium]|nr:ATP-binding protein [Thermoanaerobaculia bacterium]
MQCAALGQAQPGFRDFTPAFEVFSLPGEIKGNYVQCIAQDSVGFLWFGTQDGLHRYDGQSITTYRHDPLEENSLADNYIEWILADSKGALWLGHYGKGVTRFDYTTGKYTRYSRRPGDPNSLSCDTVSMIVEDRRGFIWVGTHNGLNRLYPETGQCKRFFAEPANPHSLSHNLVRALYVDRQGTLWAGCGFPWEENNKKAGGLNRYHPETGTFTRYLHDPGNPNSLSDNRVRAIYEDSKGNFWVGAMGNEGLQRLDRRTGIFTRLPSAPGQASRLGTPCLQNVGLFWQDFRQVTSITEDKRGWLWIGSLSGLIIYDPASGITRHFQAASQPGSLPINFIWHISQTRDGLIWIGGGITGGMALKVNINDPMFDFREQRLNVDMPHTFWEDGSGTVWLAPEQATPTPLALYNRKSGALMPFPLEKGTGTPEPDHVFTVKPDNAGKLWVGANTGLYRVDLQTRAISRFRSNPANPQSLSHPVVMNVMNDRKGRYWVATWGGGLNLFDPKTEKFSSFRHNPSNPGSIGGDHVWGLYEDKQGNIWVGGGDAPNGDFHRNPMFLDRYNPATNSFIHALPNGEEGCACAIEGDNDGNLWILTFVQGLGKFNTAAGIFKKYIPANSNIPSRFLRSMVKAPDGKLWLTTKDALVEFDPESEIFYSYNASHGIRMRDMGIGMSCINRQGEVFFGGADGFLSFFPEKLSRPDKDQPPPIHIAGFKLANEPVDPGAGSLLRLPVWETAEIRLSHDQNVFSFLVGCFDFLNPDGNRLEFMLENYDKNWRTDLRDGEASYFNVPPGVYNFRVRGANGQGIWNKTGASVRVVVLSPWWETPWAYLLYAALVFGGAFGIYRFLVNRRLAFAEAERLKELDAVKTRLYTNITHEFRTPLTVISGMADQIRENPGEWLDEGLNMISRNSNRLLGLVNQMLDLAKLESGKMEIRLQQGDMVNYLRYLVESFHSYAQGRGVQIHFLSDMESLTMDFDPERVQQVAGNLLSNAVKFTPPGGNVYVDLRFTNDDLRLKKPEEDKSAAHPPYQQITIRVRDTGAGIPEEHLPHLFERFYQVDGTTGGSGIGLALTKELVKLMGGGIAVKSQPGKGAEFTVTLPVRREAGMPPAGAGATSAPLPAKRDREVFKAAEPPETFTDHNRLQRVIAANGRQPAAAQPLVLLAEDNADVVAYLASCLAGTYRLAVAKDGQEAVEIATEIVPDLMITDVMMPYRDGFEVCRTLRADVRTSHIPIIMLTAKADMESKLEGLEHGADAYLAKPFHKEELLLRIRKLLEMRQRLQQHYLASAGLADGAAKMEAQAPGPEDQFVQKVREVVEAHLDDSSFDVEQLCRQMAMSHSQLHRKLSALTGLAATRFIRQVRLNKAKELLRDPALKITSVAYDTGFSDPGYFGRVFRQEFGVSPQEWREGVGV